MKVKEIISMVGFLLSDEELKNYAEDSTNTASEETLKTVDDLLRCLYIVSTEIASDRLELKKEEDFSVADKKISFSEFSRPPYRIRKVLNQNGRRLPFWLKPTYLTVNSNKVKIEYSFLPNLKKLEDESDFTYTSVTDKTLAFGVIAEYKLLKGFTEEAYAWREKFEKDLLSALVPKRNLILKKEEMS